MLQGYHAKNVVKGKNKALIFICFLFIAINCGYYWPNKMDRLKLNELENKFGNRYKIHFSYDRPCVNAYLKKESRAYDNDGIEMLKIFGFDDFGKSKEDRKTCCYFINLYDENGHFISQTYYDKEAKQFKIIDHDISS